MHQQTLDSYRMDLHRRIALVLRKEPGLIPHFAERLRSKLAAAKPPDGISDEDREWYIILTLCSPLEVIRLLEDGSDRAVRLRKNSPFLSLLSPSVREKGITSSTRNQLSLWYRPDR